MILKSPNPITALLIAWLSFVQPALALSRIGMEQDNFENIPILETSNYILTQQGEVFPKSLK